MAQVYIPYPDRIVVMETQPDGRAVVLDIAYHEDPATLRAWLRDKYPEARKRT